MNTDFRLSIGFFEHPKIQKLGRRHGDSGVLAWIKVLRFTAQNKPDGLLVGLDAEDLAIAGGFTGDAAEFIGTLEHLRLLDAVEGGWRIHDWEQHNPWAADATKRTETARNAAKARWDNQRNAGASLVKGTQDAPALRRASKRNAPILSSPIQPDPPSPPVGGQAAAEAPPEDVDEHGYTLEERTALLSAAQGMAVGYYELDLRFHRLLLDRSMAGKVSEAVPAAWVALPKEQRVAWIAKAMAEAREKARDRGRWLKFAVAVVADHLETGQDLTAAKSKPGAAQERPSPYAGKPWVDLWTPSKQGTRSDAKYLEDLVDSGRHHGATDADPRRALDILKASGVEAAMDYVWSCRRKHA